MSGKRNVSVCRGHELANALYIWKCDVTLKRFGSRLTKLQVILGIAIASFNIRAAQTVNPKMKGSMYTSAS